MKEYIRTDKAPDAIGPYSQGIILNEMIYTSGQIAIDPATQEFINGDIEVQTRAVLKNLEAVLKAAGSSLDNAVKVNIFLKDMNDFVKVNKIYGEYFLKKPARSTVEVSRLPKDALIEIDCIAFR